VAEAAVNAFLADALEAERKTLQIGTDFLTLIAAFARNLRDPAEEGSPDDPLTPEQHEQIRLTVWRLQNAFEELANPKNKTGLREALSSLSFLAQTLRDTLVAWTELMDELVEEAERLYGTQPGRGAYKREQVRAAVLTIARREAIDIPIVPQFLEPLAFVYLADIFSDFVVAHLDDNDLWDRDNLPETPALRVRMSGPLIRALRKAFDFLSRFLAGVAWRLVMGSARLSPGMQRIVDKIDPDIEGALAAVAALARFAKDNRDFVRAIARILGMATQQAETFRDMPGPQKQAYALELVMEFLEQNGLLARDGLWHDVVRAWLKVGIDATVRLFNRRRLFPFHAESA
jgi:hypothetical protein